MRQLAKLFLNNLYGKMASSMNSSFKVAFEKDDGSVGFYEVDENDKNPDTFQLVQLSLVMPETLPFVQPNKTITEMISPDLSTPTQTVYTVTCRLSS